MENLNPHSILPSLLGSIRTISSDEFTARAKNIKLLLTDNDGVLTDTGVYYSEPGEAFKRFSIRDGMGVERLRALGIETGIITGETSGSLKTRAAKLGIDRLYLGVKDKLTFLEPILTMNALEAHEIAYIGDDINDLEALMHINGHGITAAPADAMPQVKDIVHYLCAWRAGNGAFRDFAEAIITLKSI